MNEPARKLTTPWIFIDTVTYRENRLDWSGKILSTLKSLSRAGTLRLLVTEITKREVYKRIDEELDLALASINKNESVFRQLDLIAEKTRRDRTSSQTVLRDQFENYLVEANAVNVPLDADPSSILEDYFNGTPPFGAGSKKAEFPDAFVIASLRNWCLKNNRTMYVVSKDQDMVDSCVSGGPLLHLNTVGEAISLASALGDLQAKIVSLLNDKETFSRAIEKRLTRVKAKKQPSVSDLDSFTIDEISVDDINIVEHKGNTIYAEVEIEVFASALVTKEEVKPYTNRYGDVDLDLIRYQEEVSGYIYVTAECEFDYDPDDDEISNLDILSLNPDEFDLGSSGRGKGVRFRIR